MRIKEEKTKFFLPPPKNGAALSRVFAIMRHGVAQVKAPIFS
jgi:hypothetical protein